MRTLVQLIVAAPVLGAVCGAGLWSLLGQGLDRAPAIADVEARLAAVRPARAEPVALAATSILPLFPVTPAVSADVPESAPVRVTGLARSNGRSSALISIGSASGKWVKLGQTVDGVTLEKVTPVSVVIRTAAGSQEIVLAERKAAQMATAASVSAPSTGVALSEQPPGFRGPSPPADAPKGRP